MKVSDFGPFTLSEGSHENPSEGMCFMEMVSFLAGEEWSDRPACASPVLSRFCVVGNDQMDQSKRDRLQLYVPKMIGTYSPKHEQARSEYLAWQAIRVFAPMALEAVGLTAHADALQSAKTLQDARPAARAATRAAVDAARAPDATADAAPAAHYASMSASAAVQYYALDNLVDTALYAARAAVYAAKTSDADSVWEKYFEALDGAIAIGPSGEAYTPEHLERIPVLRDLLTA